MSGKGFLWGGREGQWVGCQGEGDFSTGEGGEATPVGGANLNFKVRLRGKMITYFKNKKKYHENQREKLILMIFVS
jgi:hypothetical protein